MILIFDVLIHDFKVITLGETHYQEYERTGSDFRPRNNCLPRGESLYSEGISVGV